MIKGDSAEVKEEYYRIEKILQDRKKGQKRSSRSSNQGEIRRVNWLYAFLSGLVFLPFAIASNQTINSKVYFCEDPGN